MDNGSKVMTIQTTENPDVNYLDEDILEDYRYVATRSNAYTLASLYLARVLGMQVCSYSFRTFFKSPTPGSES